MPKPHSKLRHSFANEVVRPRHCYESKWEVVRNDKDLVAFLHLVREGPVVFLVFRQCILNGTQQIADVRSEVKPNVSGGQAIDRVSNAAPGSDG